MVTPQCLWRLKNSLREIHFFERQILQVFLHFQVCFLSSPSQWSVDQKINACAAVSPSWLPGCSFILTVVPDVNACFWFQLFCCCCCCGVFFLCLCDQSYELFPDMQETIGWHWFFSRTFIPPVFIIAKRVSILMSDPNLSYNFHRKMSLVLRDYEAAVPRIPF